MKIKDDETVCHAEKRNSATLGGAVMNFHVSRIANLFYFASHMTLWHWSMRERNYRRYWLEETGPLSEEEHRAIEVVKQILSDHPYGNGWIGTTFLTVNSEEEAGQGAQIILTSVELLALRNALDELSPRFQRIWEYAEQKLKGKTAKLSVIIDSESVQDGIKILERLLTSSFPNLEIHMLLSKGAENASGTANEGPGHICLECMETEDLGLVVDLLLHEAGHLMQEAVVAPLVLSLATERSLTKEDKSDRRSDISIIQEAVLQSLCPNGILSKQALGREPWDWLQWSNSMRDQGRMDLARLYQFVACVTPLTKPYLCAGKRFDQDLLMDVMEAFEQVYREN